VGPTLYTTGPTLNRRPAQNPLNIIVTPEAGADEVARQRAAGYDYIKVYNNIPRGTKRPLKTPHLETGAVA